jgi:hypothetical protein
MWLFFIWQMSYFVVKHMLQNSNTFPSKYTEVTSLMPILVQVVWAPDQFNKFLGPIKCHCTGILVCATHVPKHMISFISWYDS